MGLDVVNPHVAKIILAAEDGDSVNGISRKIGTSYGWTHKWVERLEEIDVIRRDNGIHVVDAEFADTVENLARIVVRRQIELGEAYLLPNFAGMPYAYTKTDAVYVWTKGGYQIGRTHEDYPIFIEIHEEEVPAWQQFFTDFSVETAIEERTGDGIHFVLYPTGGTEWEWVENARVIPLDQTVEWAQTYKANFQPALEMLDELYGLDLGVTYRERAPE